MEKIRISHSLQKNLPICIGLIAVLFVPIIVYFHNESLPWWMWLLVILFVGSGIFLLIFYLKEWLTGESFLVISDKGLTINMLKKREILFSDIASIDPGNEFLRINYKDGIEVNHHMYFNLSVDDLNMKPEAIWSLLNERLQKSREQVQH